ncbi:transcriptional regulator [Saccharobesus litoralis]|uniref:Transcriptional regulator n=1 Tax=Saccharobesus litoralis TaxID=2172099 RepID=A0A2S0VMG2_9ALTE|nr:nuclear transport factor 2 family protein [Saccharobesus litoralis]AWB65407.1 transcriptional regulator [Saccharobesus litoralis]
MSQLTQTYWLTQFIECYEALGVEDFSSLTQVYHANVHFQDPIHQINGINDLTQYFQQLYTQVTACQFKVIEVLESKNNQQAAIYWQMTYQHKQLNAHKPITVEGHSLLKTENDKVIYHRDYLDVGAMLYEHIPLLGSLVKTIKKRASRHE